MLFSLEVLDAADGDCLLLHWGKKDDPKIALIDGGRARVYEDVLRPRLEEIVENLNIDRLALELVMISHMDDDHIVGIRELMRALRTEVEKNVPLRDRTVRVKRLWHNVFNDVLGDPVDKYYTKLTASVQASVGGSPNPQLIEGLAKAFESRQGASADEAREDAQAVAAVLAAYSHGRAVRDDHKFLYDNNQIAYLNAPFSSPNDRPTLITAEKTPTPVKIEGLEVQVLGPMEAEIDALQTDFDAYINEKGLSAEAVLAAYADRSVKNLSSIVCLTLLGGKSILLTGDASGKNVIAGLEKAGLLAPNTTLSVDILKMPHHGSDRNVASDFFKRIVAGTYVFPGDGANGNPDRSTLQWLSNARGESATYQVVLTHEVDEIDKKRKEYAEKNNKTWKAAKDSLKAYFQDANSAGYKFKVTAGAPVKIELGSERVAW